MAVVHTECLCPMDSKRARRKAFHAKNREAQLAKMRAYYYANKEHLAAMAAARYRENREQVCAHQSQRYYANREVAIAYAKARYAANYIPKPKKPKKYNSAAESTRAWVKANPDKYRETAAKWRRQNRELATMRSSLCHAQRKSRLHPEIDHSVVAKLFSQCVELKRSTGVVYHVDHIIPLAKGGWHHHHNLQLLPAHINLEKNADPLWEHEGYKSWRDVPEFLWPDKLAPIYREKTSKN